MITMKFPEAILVSSEWDDLKLNRPVAARPVPKHNPPSPPKHTISEKRLATSEIVDGHRRITFYDDNELQVMPGVRYPISDRLSLFVPEGSEAVQWRITCVEGTFPKEGGAKIDLVKAANEKLTAKTATEQLS